MRPIAHQAKAPESKPDANEDLKSLPLPELQARLGSSPDGISQVEAQKRLAQYGPNEIEEKKTNPFLKFLTYFWGPIPWMIEAAGILSALVRHWPDFSSSLFCYWPTRRSVSGRNTRQVTPSPRSRPSWRFGPASGAM